MQQTIPFTLSLTSYLKAEWQHVSVPLYLRAHLPQEALSESIFCNNLTDTVPNKT